MDFDYVSFYVKNKPHCIAYHLGIVGIDSVYDLLITLRTIGTKETKELLDEIIRGIYSDLFYKSKCTKNEWYAVLHGILSFISEEHQPLTFSVKGKKNIKGIYLSGLDVNPVLITKP